MMNNENFPQQLSKVKVTVNSNLNSIGLSNKKTVLHLQNINLRWNLNIDH